ncbi:MAG: ABC transporter substrate-binding protein [Cyanobacteria bacterium J06632_22]
MSKSPFSLLTLQPLRSLSTAALALAVLLGGAACQAPTDTTVEAEAPEAAAEETDTAAAPAEMTPVSFTLSWLLQGVDGPLTLAIDRGYFAEEGLDVSFERGFGSSDTASKIAAGQYDMGFGDIYSMIEFNQQNPDDKLIAVAVTINKAPFALLTFKESGIESLDDVAGKKLGAPVGDAPRRLWPVLATEVGVDAEAVEWVSMEPKLRQSFLLQGNVDAISGFTYSMIPALVEAGKTLDDMTIFYYTENGLNFYGNVILVKESFLEENPEVVRGFVAAYIKGLQDTVSDPEAGLEAVMAAGDELMDADAERLRLQIAMDGLLVNEEVEEIGFGAIDPARLEATIAQTVAGFDLPETPAVEDVFDDSFLPPLEERQVPDEIGSL